MDILRFVSASEAAVLVEFGDGLNGEIRPEIVQRIHRLVALLDLSPLDGLLEVTPAYSSLLVEFDPLRLLESDVIGHVRFCLEQIGQIKLPSVQTLEIPVFYGGEYGPDLPYCAERLKMSVSQLVEAHCDQVYSVAFFGFLPGFAYLIGWPQKWAMPRLDSPRAKVPAGSVAIAGSQCGVYPTISPGGWRILGRTPARVIDLERKDFCLFPIGAQVRFYPSSPSAW
ncbi:MAG: allophanate hydrolase subunit 1 [Acidobacteria bacterium]|nr:allophanate hydrolase subunit 1 [Acidobacteriota bacterium]